MDTKLKSQLYDIISLAETKDNNNLVEIGNVKIREEDVEKYLELQKKIDVIKPENQEVPLTNFPGTDVPRPRFRNYDETEEEYVAFLQEYYSVYFEAAKNQTVKKGAKKRKTSKKAFTPLNDLEGEVLTKESNDLSNAPEEETTYEIPALAGITGEKLEPEEISLTNQDTIEMSTDFEEETPLMSIDGEELTKESQDIVEQEETKISSEDEQEDYSNVAISNEELERLAMDSSSDLEEDALEYEDTDYLEESEVISIKNIPKKLWEVVKSIPFIGKAMQYLEDIITKNKEEDQRIVSQLGDEMSYEINSQSRNQSFDDTKDDAKSTSSKRADFRVNDNIDKLIINGVEPLTGAFTRQEELFDKIEKGTAYDYSELEMARIENVKDAVNPEMDAFFISKILHKKDDGTVEEVKSAREDDLNSLIFEVSSKDIPDYVFARYSGKSVSNALKNQDTIVKKAM